jgi:hypothetical protein
MAQVKPGTQIAAARERVLRAGRVTAAHASRAMYVGPGGLTRRRVLTGFRAFHVEPKAEKA